VRYYYPYESFREDLKILVKKIEKSYEFDCIVAIARGGMAIGLMMGEYFDNRYVFTVNSIGYEDDRKLEDVKIFNIPHLKGFKRVLIVDDIVDSGESMKKVVSVLKERYPGHIFKSAAIFQKPNASFKADFFVKKPLGWVDFFWSVDLKK
jgi:xanthine phosphoribosyltransferase